MVWRPLASAPLPPRYPCSQVVRCGGPLTSPRTVGAGSVRFSSVVGLRRCAPSPTALRLAVSSPALLGSALGCLAFGEPFCPLRDGLCVAHALRSRRTLSDGLPA